MKSYYLYIPILLSCLFPLQSDAQQNAAKPFVKVYGELTNPLTLYADDLAKMKRHTVTMKHHDGREQAYSGAAVEEILQNAGVSLGKELRGKNLTKYLIIKCADGYQVLFALAELDTGFTDRVVILADESSGRPLPDNEGPFRLVVPGEKRPARSSYQVTEMVIRSAKE